MRRAVALGCALAPEGALRAGVITMDDADRARLTARRCSAGRRSHAPAARATCVHGDRACVPRSSCASRRVLPPLMLVLAIAESWRRSACGTLAQWRSVFAALGVTTLLLLDAGYLFPRELTPLAGMPFQSQSFRAASRRRPPSLAACCPTRIVMGSDRQAVESQAGRTPSYLLGMEPDAPPGVLPRRARRQGPLGFFAALCAVVRGTPRASAVRAARREPGLRPWRCSWIAMFVGRFPASASATGS